MDDETRPVEDREWSNVHSMFWCTVDRNSRCLILTSVKILSYLTTRLGAVRTVPYAEAATHGAGCDALHADYGVVPCALPCSAVPDQEWKKLQPVRAGQREIRGSERCWTETNFISVSNVLLRQDNNAALCSHVTWWRVNNQFMTTLTRPTVIAKASPWQLIWADLSNPPCFGGLEVRNGLESRNVAGRCSSGMSTLHRLEIW